MHIYLNICMYVYVFDTKEADLEKEKGERKAEWEKGGITESKYGRYGT